MGYSIPGQSTSKGINYSNVNTTDGGGQYDIEGRNGVGGRVYLENINLYNHENSYGIESVDTSLNRVDGQFVVE